MRETWTPHGARTAAPHPLTRRPHRDISTAVSAARTYQTACAATRRGQRLRIPRRVHPAHDRSRGARRARDRRAGAHRARARHGRQHRDRGRRAVRARRVMPRPYQASGTPIRSAIICVPGTIAGQSMRPVRDPRAYHGRPRARFSCGCHNCQHKFPNAYRKNKVKIYARCHTYSFTCIQVSSRGP